MPRYLFEWLEMLKEHGPEQLTTRAVGLALSDYANADGDNAHPSQQRLADDLATSRRTVSTHLANLEESGWIARHQRGRGLEYELTIPREARETCETDSQDDGGPVKQIHERDSHVKETHETDSHESPSHVKEDHRTCETDSQDPRKSFTQNANEIAKKSQAQQRSAPTDTGAPDREASSADEVAAYFRHQHHREIDEQQAERLADGLKGRGIDPIDYLHSRENDGIYSRMSHTPSLVDALLDDAAVPPSDTDPGPEQTIGRHDDPPATTDSTDTDEQTDGGRPWPPEGFEQLDGHLAGLEVAPDTLDQMSRWAFRRDEDTAKIASRDPVELELTGRRYCDVLEDALGVDDVTLMTEVADE